MWELFRDYHAWRLSWIAWYWDHPWAMALLVVAVVAMIVFRSRI